MDYVGELQRGSTVVVLCGQPVEVARARLGEWFALDRIQRSAAESRMLDYVAAASGVPKGDLEDRATISEVMAAYQQICRLNRLHGRFPFMGGGKGNRRDVLDYPGRELASAVHAIASAYGWRRDDILSLGPEEALFYVLEIEVDRHHQREWQYNISQVGFDKRGRKTPYPPLGWRWDQPQQAAPARRHPRSDNSARAARYAPQGVVIDIGTLYSERAAQQQEA